MISFQNLEESDVLTIYLEQDYRLFIIEVLTPTGKKFKLQASNEDGSPMEVAIGRLRVVSNFYSRDNVRSLGELESIGRDEDRLVLEGDFGDISLNATKIDIEQVLPFSPENEHGSSEHSRNLPNMRKLLTVHDCIEVRGRGQMLVGLAEGEGPVIHKQQNFTLVTKGGALHSATAIRVEYFKMYRSDVLQIGILVGEQLANVGWLIDSDIWIAI